MDSTLVAKDAREQMVRESLSLPVKKAVAWVKANRVAGGGIAVHHKSRIPTQEVTGYLIPTLVCKNRD